jgi:hypothetical protein
VGYADAPGHRITKRCSCRRANQECHTEIPRWQKQHNGDYDVRGVHLEVCGHDDGRQGEFGVERVRLEIARWCSEEDRWCSEEEE